MSFHRSDCHIKNRKLLYSRKKGKMKLTGVLAACLFKNLCQFVKNEEPLFPIFSHQKRCFCNLCLAAHDSFHRQWSYSDFTLWAQFLTKQNLCQVCADFFLAHAHLVMWFTMSFTVCQKESCDTVQFWCQPSPGFTLSSRGTAVSLLYFKRVSTEHSAINMQSILFLFLLFKLLPKL